MNGTWNGTSRRLRAAANQRRRADSTRSEILSISNLGGLGLPEGGPELAIFCVKIHFGSADTQHHPRNFTHTQEKKFPKDSVGFNRILFDFIRFPRTGGPKNRSNKTFFDPAAAGEGAGNVRCRLLRNPYDLLDAYWAPYDEKPIR